MSSFAKRGKNAAPQPEAKHMHRGIDEAAVAALYEKVMDRIIQIHAGELDDDARNIIKAMVIGAGVKSGKP